MGLAETAQLAINISLKGNARAGVSQLQRDLGKLDSSASRIRTATAQGLATASRNLQRVAAVGAIAIADQVRRGIESLATLEDAIVSADGAIAQVGKTWTITGADIAREANRIEEDVQRAFDDKAIAQGATALIRYGSLAEENLIPALEVMTDLAAKTGSVDSASSLLAKALADPAKAAGRLTRIGIVLTDQQQEQIEAMTEAGDIAGAQATLLDILAERTEGAAAAMHGPYRDAMNILSDVTEDAQRALAEGFLPLLERVADELSDFLADPKNIERIRDFGRGLAEGFDKLIDMAGKIPWGTIGDSLKIAGAGAKALFDAFTGLPPWVQTAVLTGWGLNKLSGGALGTVLSEGLKIGVRSLASRIGGLFEDLSLGRSLRGSLFGPGGALRGQSPATPIFTKEVGLGAAGAGTGAGSIAGAGALGVTTVALAAVSVTALVAGLGLEIAKIGPKGISEDQLERVLNSPDTAPATGAARGSFGKGFRQVGPQHVIVDKPIALQGMSPDERQEAHDRAAADKAAQAKLDILRDETESNRIAIQTMQRAVEAKSDAIRLAEQAVRDRVESNRIATQSGLALVRSAEQAGTAAIVAAIRASQAIVNVSVTGMTQTVVKTGTTTNEYGGGSRNRPR